MKGSINLSTPGHVDTFLKDQQEKYQQARSRYYSGANGWQTVLFEKLVVSPKDHRSYVLEKCASLENANALETSSLLTHMTGDWVPNPALSNALIRYESQINSDLLLPLQSLWHCEFSGTSDGLPMLLDNGTTISLDALNRFQLKDSVRVFREPWKVVFAPEGIKNIVKTCFAPYPEYSDPQQTSRPIGGTETCLNADLLSLLLTYNRVLSNKNSGQNTSFETDTENKLLVYMEELKLWKHVHQGEIIFNMLVILILNKIFAPNAYFNPIFGLECSLVSLTSLLLGLNYFKLSPLDKFSTQAVCFTSMCAIDWLVGSMVSQTLPPGMDSWWIIASLLRSALLLGVCAASHTVSEDVLRLRYLKLEVNRTLEILNQIENFDVGLDDSNQETCRLRAI